MDSILNFWFPDDNYQKWWFKSTDNLDRVIYNTYYDIMYKQYDNFKEQDYSNVSPSTLISTIVLFDQFSRNMARINNISTIDVNDFTKMAMKLTNIWLIRNLHLTEPIKYTVFALLPIRHMKQVDCIKDLVELLNSMEEQNSDLKTNIIFNKFKSATIRNLYNI